jgi:hypothetical protein
VAHELADVIHYFLPDARGAGEDAERRTVAGVPVAVPLAERDAMRAAIVWNLANELARMGGRPLLLAPDDAALGALRECLPEPDAPAPRGPELRDSPARSLGALARDAAEAFRARPADAGPDFVLLPSRWIRPDSDAAHLLAAPLLFTTPAPDDAAASLALAARILAAAPQARVGVTVYGVSSLGAARRGFEELDARARRELGRGLVSYGVLLEELQIYRAAVSRRPVAIARPQSLAARSLADVARLLREDQGGAPR